MAHPYARKRARRFLVGRPGRRVGSNGRGCHTSAGQAGSTYDKGSIPDMCTLWCTATLPVRGEHSMKHSGRRLPLQYTLCQRREFTCVRSFKPGQISVKPSFWLSLSTSMALLVQLEALLQQLHHSHPTADRIALILPLELRHHFEIQ